MNFSLVNRKLKIALLCLFTNSVRAEQVWFNYILHRTFGLFSFVKREDLVNLSLCGFAGGVLGFVWRRDQLKNSRIDRLFSTNIKLKDQFYTFKQENEKRIGNLETQLHTHKIHCSSNFVRLHRIANNIYSEFSEFNDLVYDDAKAREQIWRDTKKNTR